MREILFRGKREYKDKEWAFGSLHSEYGETDKNGQRKIDYRILGMRGECDYVLPETVGQFTGLNDKNGKKIFEGDILRFLAYGTVYTGKVEFLNGAFWVKCRFHDRIGAIVHEYKPEIIGNIHDNPELLGGAEDG